MGLDWQPRSVPQELASGYRKDGFWTDESLGGVLAGRLAARREQTFKLRSDVRLPTKGASIARTCPQRAARKGSR